jgi:hypothetical protein
MKSKLFALVLAAAGLALSAGSALAQDRYYDRQDLRHDYGQRNRLRSDIARDQARLNEAYRRGRWGEARAIQRDLDRDYRALDALNRDIRHDQRDLRYDRGYYSNGWR